VGLALLVHLPKPHRSEYYNTSTLPAPARRITLAVEKWFARHQRPLPWRVTYDPWLVWVSEVMLQQTRMEVVLRYYGKFVGRFPTVASLAASTEDEVLSAWSGLGYYRRARMLRDGAREVEARFGGQIPATVEELRTISGIGRYTAGAIASIAFGKHAPIVDGNVARIVSRLSAIAAPVASPELMRAAWIEEEHLVAACRSPREFNQGLMEIGALICKPAAPLCEACPLTAHCIAFRTDRQTTLPLPKPKPETVSLVVPLYLITDDEQRVLMRRERGKLMTSMFHLPHGDTGLIPAPPLAVRRGRLLGAFRHTVTTRKIRFELFAADAVLAIRDGGDYAWVHPDEVDKVPHPSYVDKALAIAALQSSACAGG
jgi:A/G-specific adenine glycosylase